MLTNVKVIITITIYYFIGPSIFTINDLVPVYKVSFLSILLFRLREFDIESFRQ